MKAKNKDIKFAKMSGAGNDFIVIDNFSGSIKLTDKEIIAICTPKFAVGADGVLQLEKPASPDYDFTMRYNNADGSIADMCGNGARCLARFAYLNDYAGKKVRFLAGDGEHLAQIEKSGRVKLSMIDPRDIKLGMTVKVNGKTVKGSYANTGVPHFVTEVKNLAAVDVKNFGKALRFHRDFGVKGANVNFVQKKNGAWHIRTYERGVEEETFACGTGATAAGILLHLTKKESPVAIEALGGLLRIYFAAAGKSVRDVFLEGDARVIAEGVINKEAFDF